jgi:DNA polymerase elongation subunit (family B)
MVVFEALTWEARDFEDLSHLISIFGRTEDGKSVCVTTAFKPYFFVKLPKNTTQTAAQLTFSKIKKACPAVVDFSLSKAKDLWGFQNNEEFPFMKLNFATIAGMRQCDYKLRYPLKDETYVMKVYESNIEPMLRLMHRSGIQSTGWLDTGSNCQPAQMAKVDIDLYCSDWTELKPVARDDIAPFIIASFDIETNSSTGKFPDADIQGDACFQIAITLKRQGETELYDKTCLCYKPTATNLEGCTIVNFDTERELLLGFRDYVLKHDIDVITGWNIFGFDLEYVYKRAMITGCLSAFSELSKLRDHTCEMMYKKLSSSALGDNILKLLPMPGRFIFDLFHEVKREQKLDSYSLNFVSTTFLGDQKIDMSPKEMFRRFREEDPEELKEVAEYCIKDTILPHRLMDKMCTFLNLIEMAKATWVPVCYLSERGQQIKVFSQMTRKARELNFMVPTIRYGKLQSDPYEGATVLEAQTGAYYTPITALDFASLYPSIMMAHNLCYSTLVLDPKYDSLPGVEYESFNVGERTYKFAQNVPSLLPRVLEELKAFRKQAKKDMANATGAMKSVYNGKQLAYKISMNSVYGFTGAGKGMLPCVPIASTVTCKGRSMIEETKNYVETHFEGAVVRYGDSVTEDTALLLRVDGVVTVRRIDELCGTGWVQDGDGKEFSKLQGVETWTEKGWSVVHNVIRHDTDKKILKVLTHTGCVSVTEDHSLLSKSAEMVKPNEVSNGDELLHSFPSVWETRSVVSEEKARLFGFFLGDGSCGYYPNCDKSSWQLNNADHSLLKMYAEILRKEYPEYDCAIYDTMKSSGVYKLSLLGHVKKMSTEFQAMFYTDARNKKIPDCMFTETAAVKEAFIRGLYDADGDKVGPGRRIDQKSQVTSLGIFTILNSLGYNVSINTRTDKPEIYRLTFSKSPFRKNPDAIKKIEVVEYAGKVYDLTTDNHHFHAGVGNLIVHNTDSVMVEFDVQGRTGIDAIEYSWKLGEQAAEECSRLFKHPNDLELEKVYCPYFLYSKKRYAAKLWTKGKSGKMQMDYLDIKGLQVVRRDNTLFVREVCKEILDVIMESKNPDGAVELAKRRATELLEGKVPIEKLTLSQKLADSYKSTNLAHVNVRDKMREREPGSEPQSGDRVQFVLVDTGDPKARQFEKAEDPAWVRQNNLPLDYQYYFTNKFMNPVCDLLEPLVDKVEVFRDIIAPKKKRAVKSK